MGIPDHLICLLRNLYAGQEATGATAADGSGTGTGTGTGKTEEKKPVELASVKSPPVPNTPQKGQRKPRTKKAKKETPQSFNAEQISLLIVSLSSIVASRDGLDMMLISKTEADQIATPLANIIAKNESLSGLSEHTDAIALVTACIVIMLPRVMLLMEKNKAKKLQNNGGLKLERTDNKKSAGNGDNRKPVGTSSADVTPHADDVFTAIPTII